MKQTVGRKKQNIINHIGLVLDKSMSMARHKGNLIKAADALVAHLANRSKEMDQETRISVWTFSDAHSIECVVWDKDVLRLPSIADFYSPNGNTALVDATLLSIEDLGLTPEKYGDHSFLVYVLTDGEENASRNVPATLASRLEKLPDHWTVGALVPNIGAKHEVKKLGFVDGNIEIWNINSSSGITEAYESVTRSADNYMTSRSMGIRSTRNLFSTAPDAVNSQSIKAAGLRPLGASQYRLVPVGADKVRIDEFTEKMGYRYVTGRGFYQLSKLAPRAVLIQPQKEIAVVEKKSDRVFVGAEARNLIGLPTDLTVRVRPDHNPDFDIFVQSTSINRILLPGTKYLWLL